MQRAFFILFALCSLSLATTQSATHSYGSQQLIYSEVQEPAAPSKTMTPTEQKTFITIPEKAHSQDIQTQSFSKWWLLGIFGAIAFILMVIERLIKRRSRFKALLDDAKDQNPL